MGFSTLRQVQDYIESFSNSGSLNGKLRTYRLDRMKTLMDKLGNPQNTYKTIHVAGSKGKGSTSAFIAAGLKAAGFRTGLYLSPHALDFRERFTLCGEFFSDDIILKTADSLISALEHFEYGDESGISHPTTFELYTALAFMLFKEAGCSWAVIETGLGGRLDATNILSPQASVITPIELEHTEILGDTIKKIATEKSKIIKPEVPVFIANQTEEALDVLISEAENNNSPVYILNEEILDMRYGISDGLENVKLNFRDGLKENFNLKMPGKVQAENCALAVLVLDKLKLYRNGISNTEMNGVSLPARMQIIKKQTVFCIDGAHTKKSIENTVETFNSLFPGHNGICIFGCVSDKKYQWMSRIILDNFSTVIVSRPGTFKQSNPEELFGYINGINRKNRKIILLKNPEDALKFCIEHNSEKQPVLVCGSFYLAGEFLKIFAEEKCR